MEKSLEAKSHQISEKMHSTFTEEQLRMIKRTAIGAAIGLGAGVAVYYVAKRSSSYVTKDLVIPSSELLQRVSPASEQDLHDVFYAAYGQHDKDRYEGWLPNHYHERGANEVIKKMIQHEGDIKIAGHDTCENIFKKVLPEEYRFLFDSYDEFNQYAVARNDPQFKKIYQTFFNELKARGYSGFLDINDQKYSGYNAKAPLILFNDNKFSVKDVQRISNEGEKYARESLKVIKEMLLKDISDNGGQAITKSLLYGAVGGVVYNEAFATSPQTFEDEERT